MNVVKRLVAAIITFTVLVFLYALYGAAFQRRWQLEELPPEWGPEAAGIGLLSHGAIPANDAARKAAVEAFGPDCWQADAVISLYWQDEGIFLYANEYQFPSRQRMVLSPVSIVRRKVLPRQATPELLVLEAERATLDFDRPIDLSNFWQSQPTSTALQGNLRLAWNRGTAAPEDDVFAFLERLVYDRQHQVIWTDGKIRVVSEEATLEGEGGRAVLQKEAGRSQAARLRSVELQRKVHIEAIVNEQLRAALGRTPAGAQRPEGSPPGKTAPTESDPQIAMIESRGPLFVDPEQWTATFRDGVTVALRTAEGSVDRLSCDELQLLWERPPQNPNPQEPSRSEHQPASEPASRQLQLTLREALAMGQPVLLESPGRALQVRATRARYDQRGKTIQLESSTEVAVDYDGFRLTVPRLSLTLQPDQTVRGIAPGPGQLASTDESRPERRFHARWQGEAQLEPVEDHYVVTLSDRVQVEEPGQGTVTADRSLRLWFDRRAAPRSQRLGKATSLQLPTRLEATGNVRLDAPQLRVLTQVLTAFVRAGAPGQSPAPEKAARASQRGASWVGAAEGPGTSQTPAVRLLSPYVSPRGKVRGRAPSLTVFHPFLGSNGSSAPETGPMVPGEAAGRAAQPAAAPREPHGMVELTAERVRAQLAVQDEELTADEVWADGNVQLRHRQADAPGQEDLQLNGSGLHLKNLGQGYFFEVTGEPAQVSVASLDLRGPLIGFDQPTEVAWIRGAGEMKFRTRRVLGAAHAPQETTATVRWAQEMFFDGLVAEFTGDVQVQQEATSIRCDRVEAFLSERVSLRASRSRQRQTPSLKRLVASGRARLEARRSGDPESAGRTSIQGSELVFDQEEGRLVARGPGQFWMARYGATPEFLSEPVEAASQRPPQWSGTLVLFEHHLELAQERGYVQVVGRVRLWHAPVKSADDTFQIDQLPMDNFHLQCDQLELLFSEGPRGEVWTNAAAVEEFLARGNARLEAKGFYAQADLLKYDRGLKPGEGKFVAEGLGENFATFYRQVTPGRRADVLQARKIYYWPKTGEFRQEGGILLDVQGDPSRSAGRAESLPRSAPPGVSPRGARPNPAP
jgi:hypothetical protein